MTTVWGKWCAVGGILLGLTYGTGCAVPDSGAWGREAEAWLDAYDAAFARNDGGTVLFYTEDVVSDHSMLGGTGDELLAVGRPRAVEVEKHVYGMDYWWGPLFLGTESAVRIELWAVDGVSDGGLAEIVIGPDGIERYTHHEATYYGSGHMSDRQVQTADAAVDIAERYAAVWSTGDQKHLEQFYATGATLEDSMSGQWAEGVASIARLGRDTAVPISVSALGDAAVPLALQTYPEPIGADSPVVFQHLEPDRYGALSEVWVLVESEAQCPGQWYAALRLDGDGAVVVERRYRSLDSIRLCVDPGDRVTGWWTDRDLPLPLGERVTGTFDTEAGPVEIRNGTAGATALLEWAYGRFALAGLAAPRVSAISFDPLDDRCHEVTGYADWSEGTTQVLVCFDSAGLAPTYLLDDGTAAMQEEGRAPRSRLLLHELSHAWVHEETTEAARGQLVELVGAASWNDRDDPWRDRGVEWAAESIAWGLQGVPGGSVPLHTSDCSQLAAGYRLLTAQDPPTPCPESS